MSETDVPVEDDGGPSDLAIGVLFDRIQRTEKRHQRVRRIELLTLHQFLASGRHVPSDVLEPLKALDEAVRSFTNEQQAPDARRLVQQLKELIPLPQRRPITLVLRGGGIKGLAFCGALEVLTKYYDPTAIVGTSAGAITAVLLAAGYAPSELVQELKTVAFSEFLEAGPIRRVFNLLTKQGLHTGVRITAWLSGLLTRRLGTGIVHLRDLPLRVVILASKVSYGSVKFDSRGERSDASATFAARCSMSIPVVFTPQLLDGIRVWDGGLLNNVPIDQLSGDLRTLPFIGIYLGTIGEPRNRPFWALDILRVWLGGDEVALADEHRDSVIAIDVAPIKTMDFALSDCEKELLIARGQLAALTFVERRGFLPEVSSEVLSATVAKVAELEASVRVVRRRRARWRLVW